MQWSELMQQVYKFWGRIGEMLDIWLAKLTLVGDQVLQALVGLLAQLGVPPHLQLMAAYAYCFTLVTLLVLWLALRMVRRARRSDKLPAKVKDSGAAVEAGVEVAPSVDIAEVEPVSIFAKMKAGLSKTQAALIGQIDALFNSPSAIDEIIEELEEILITADFGMKTTQLLLAAFKRRVNEEKVAGAPAMRAILQEEILRLMTIDVAPLNVERECPFVLLVIGVNGVGKTTTIGKLAQQFSLQGKKVILGAADTFRAAAAEQLQVWGERTGVTVIRHDEGADPAAVAFDAAKATVARKADILILDTAGRLHTKVNLMEEMKKIYRVLGREIPDAPHETLLVLDATTGQNALVQARLFQEAVGVTGVVITKLDGTAKGGMAVAIGAELGLPVRYVGVGEGVDDLRPFDPEIFVAALFENH